MMLRRISLIAIGLAVIGCGSGGRSLAGTWSGTFKGANFTIVANPDTSFAASGASKMKGRWEVSGKEVKLFRDVRDGGDVGFGDGGDGAMHFQLSDDGKSFSGKVSDGTMLEMKKQ